MTCWSLWAWQWHRPVTSYEHTRIRVVDADGELLKEYSMAELLPDAFGPENLSQVI